MRSGSLLLFLAMIGIPFQACAEFEASVFPCEETDERLHPGCGAEPRAAQHLPVESDHTFVLAQTHHECSFVRGGPPELAFYP